MFQNWESALGLFHYVIRVVWKKIGCIVGKTQVKFLYQNRQTVGVEVKELEALQRQRQPVRSDSREDSLFCRRLPLRRRCLFVLPHPQTRCKTCRRDTFWPMPFDDDFNFDCSIPLKMYFQSRKVILLHASLSAAILIAKEDHAALRFPFSLCKQGEGEIELSWHLLWERNIFHGKAHNRWERKRQGWLVSEPVWSSFAWTSTAALTLLRSATHAVQCNSRQWWANAINLRPAPILTLQGQEWAWRNALTSKIRIGVKLEKIWKRWQQLLTGIQTLKKSRMKCW